MVITGGGVLSPNGIGKEAFWQATISGKSGIDKIKSFDTTGFLTKIGGEIDDFEPRFWGLSEQQIRRMDRYVQFAIVGTKMAVEDSMIDIAKEDRDRIGICIANAICGTKFMVEEFGVITEKGTLSINPKYLRPFLYEASTFNTPSQEISALYNIHGHCFTLSTGCTGGSDAVGAAYETIAYGEADIMIAGATEAPVTSIAIASFDIIGALTTKNDSPKSASRPFDKYRDGFVLSEGCGILILEELEHALDRKAHIYAEIAGFGTVNNAYHMTDLLPEGTALARSIKLALKDAGVNPQEIDYINAHGSSTPQNDICETNAIKLVFGEAAYKIPISSIKSMIGHPLAAANSIELISCILAIEENCMPPTINYEYPDPECNLDYIPNKAREGKVDIVLKTSSGFSGIHSSIILRNPQMGRRNCVR